MHSVWDCASAIAVTLAYDKPSHVPEGSF